MYQRLVLTKRQAKERLEKYGWTGWYTPNVIEEYFDGFWDTFKDVCFFIITFGGLIKFPSSKK